MQSLSRINTGSHGGLQSPAPHLISPPVKARLGAAGACAEHRGSQRQLKALQKGWLRREGGRQAGRAAYVESAQLLQGIFSEAVTCI